MADRVLSDLFESLEFTLVGDPYWAEPSDTSYLTEEDRTDHDIMANVAAMQLTNHYIAWFGRDAEGYLGLWQGPQGTPLGDSPVLRLDSEGQYALIARTIPDYLAGSVPSEEFAGTRRTLEALGFAVSRTQEDIWASIEDISQQPNQFRDTLYQQERARRGLPPL